MQPVDIKKYCLSKPHAFEETYYHMTSNGPNYIFFASNKKPVFTGVTLHPMFSSRRYLEAEQEIIQRLARDHHIYLNLDPQTSFEFYTVPHVEVFAVDDNGYLVSLESGFSFDSEDPVYYISKDKQCFLAAKSGKELLDKGIHWKDTLIPDDKTIQLFSSRQDAEKKYTIHDLLEKEGSL